MDYDWPRLLRNIAATGESVHSSRTMAVDIKKLDGAVSSVLDALCVSWVNNGLIGPAGTGYMDFRSSTIRLNGRDITPEEFLALCALKDLAWTTTKTTLDGDEKLAGDIYLTDQGIEEAYRQSNEQTNPLVKLVSIAKERRKDELIRSVPNLYREIDRIENDLQMLLSNPKVDESYHLIAGRLHMLMVASNAAHMNRSELNRRKSVNGGQRPRITFADLYFGLGPIFGEYDGLPDDADNPIMKVANLRGWQAVSWTAVLFHNPKNFNPLRRTLLTREEWLRQRIAHAGPIDTDSAYTIAELLESIRNTVTEHSAPEDHARVRVETLQNQVRVGADRVSIVSAITHQLGMYIHSLLRVFRICAR